MDNQKLTYPELRDLFVEHNKTQLCLLYTALLSATETSFSFSSMPSGEGAELAYFKGCADNSSDSKRVAYLNGCLLYTSRCV